ncbi:MerR family transcriptional regulator [Ketobacter sp.]
MSDSDQTGTNRFPIRELCARTQVNSVTLRAWERRYGLLKPQRTDKGHRLYSETDVKRVEQIVKWIGRGVPVSRVKDLLDTPTVKTPMDTETSADNGAWQHATTRLSSAVQSMSAAKVDSCLHEYFLNYPVDTCRIHLLEPVFRSLQSSSSGLAASAFLQSELMRYVVQRLAQSKNATGSTELQLICGDNTPIWRLAMAALSLTDAGQPVQLINQPCSVKVWLDLIKTAPRKPRLIFQNGIWRAEEKAQITTILGPELWLCGAAPMTSGIAEQHPDIGTAFYPTPESAIAALLHRS